MLITFLHIGIGVLLSASIFYLTSIILSKPKSRVKKHLLPSWVLIGMMSIIIIVLAYNFGWWYLISFVPAVLILPAIYYKSRFQNVNGDKKNSRSSTDKLSKPNQIVKELIPFHNDVLSILNNIGPIKNNSFAAIFVVSVAQLRILTYKINEPKVYADEVLSNWIDYVAKNEHVQKSLLYENFEKYSPIYSELVLEIFESQTKDKTELQNRSVQLLFILYKHSTDGENPYMLKLIMLTNKIVTVINKISLKLKPSY